MKKKVEKKGYKCIPLLVPREIPVVDVCLACQRLLVVRWHGFAHVATVLIHAFSRPSNRHNVSVEMFSNLPVVGVLVARCCIAHWAHVLRVQLCVAPGPVPKCARRTRKKIVGANLNVSYKNCPKGSLITSLQRFLLLLLR